MNLQITHPHIYIYIFAISWLAFNLQANMGRKLKLHLTVTVTQENVNLFKDPGVDTRTIFTGSSQQHRENKKLLWWWGRSVILEVVCKLTCEACAHTVLFSYSAQERYSKTHRACAVWCAKDYKYEPIWAHFLGCTHILPNKLHTSFTSLVFQGELAMSRKVFVLQHKGGTRESVPD